MSGLRRWWEAAGEAALVCEIAADYVSALRCGERGIEAWSVESLPDGAVQPGSLSENVPNVNTVADVLGRVVRSVGNGRRHCALLVPDLVARVALLEFESLPDKLVEADALVRWRLGRDLPFDLKQAAVSFERQPGRGAAHEVVAVVAVRSLLRSYEECVERLGLQPGWVTLSTLAAADYVGNGRPQLLVKRDPGALGLVITHEGRTRFFRSLPLPPAERPGFVEPLFEKIYPALVYFQDQWNQSVGEAIWVGPGGDGAALAELLERETGCKLTHLSLSAEALPRAAAGGAAADRRLLPALGWARKEME
ncbi:MAG: hypothetical protein ACRD4U_05885 [Candidatus Acidiferrales bacterium]